MVRMSIYLQDVKSVSCRLDIFPLGLTFGDYDRISRRIMPGVNIVAIRHFLGGGDTSRSVLNVFRMWNIQFH